MLREIYSGWRLLPGCALEPYAHQVLSAIGRSCHPNSHYWNRQWAALPVGKAFAELRPVVDKLVGLELLEHQAGCYRPTDAGYEFIHAHRAVRVEDRVNRWRYLRIAA